MTSTLLPPPNPAALLKFLPPGKENDAKRRIEQAIEIFKSDSFREIRQTAGSPFLPAEAACKYSVQKDAVKIECLNAIADTELLESALQSLQPWRKGPFDLHGIRLDAEWDSDKKWRRIEHHLGEVWGKRVLDVGCNNGYYLLRLARMDPEYALGIDPVPRLYCQWKLLTRGLHLPRVDFHLLGVQDLDLFEKSFDLVLSLGILYHFPDPVGQIQKLYNCLRPRGRLLLESQGIPGEKPLAYYPPDRYAKAPGIHFLPTASCLEAWTRKAGFSTVRLLNSSKTNFEEQHNTAYHDGETLSDFLDPKNPELTVEGHPAPWRHLLLAEK